MNRRIFRRKSGRWIHKSTRRREGRQSSLYYQALEPRQLLAAFVVTNTNDSGIGSLRQTIIDANAVAGADTITFSSALIGQTVELTTTLPTINESLTIKGPIRGRNSITIDANGIPGVRPFVISPSALKVTMYDLTITGGNIAIGNGGGIYNSGPDTTLSNVLVTQNQAQEGGGLWNSPVGSVRIIRSEFSGNRASQNRGGAMVNDGGTCLVEDSSISANVATGAGGGIANDGGILRIRRSTMSTNLSAGGGAVTVAGPGGTTRIDQSLLVHNRALFYGGGLSFHGNHSVYVASTTIAYNIVTNGVIGLSGGGGVINDGGAVSIINSTVVGNVDLSEAPQSAGGLKKSGGILNVYNSIICENSAPSGQIENLNPSELNENLNNLIDADSRLGPLQNNGGPTLSMMPLSDSPAIDSGNNSRATVDGQIGSSALQGDQRLLSRKVDGNLNGVTTVDIGATEYNPTGTDVPFVTGADAGQLPRITLFNTDGTVRWTRMAYGGGFTGGVRVATGDINGDGVLDVVTAEGTGGLGRIYIFNGVDGALMASTIPYGRLATGVFVATGDFNNDGRDDIVAGSGGGIRGLVRVRNAANLAQNLRSIYVGLPSENAEVRVAAGDVNNDGVSDILTSMLGTVKVFDGSVATASPPLIHQFKPFGPTYNGGINLATGHFDDDGYRDIVVGRENQSSRFRTYRGNTGTPGSNPFFIEEVYFGAALGARVTTRDVDGDGVDDVIATARANSDAAIITFFFGTDTFTYTFFDPFIESTDLGMFIG